MVKTIFHLKINKKKLRIFLITAAVLTALTGVFFLSVFLAAYSGITVTADLSLRYNQITGFGGSAAWTTQNLGRLAGDGTQEEIVEALYGESGMKLSVYRYNIGGGSKELGEKIGYVEDVTATESFFISENYTDPSSFSDERNYDFGRDAGSVSVMKAAVEKGYIKKIVLFVNSPHYLLTSSKLTNGSYEYQNNLPSESYQAFSNYVLIISKYIYQTVAADKNIELYISPANEPQWRWGGVKATQEGCHYDPENLDSMMDFFFRELKAFNAENGYDFHLEAYESGSYLMKHNKEYIAAAMGSEWFDAVGTLSVHGYHKSESSSAKAKFAEYAAETLRKNVAMTEFCDLSEGRDYSMKSAMYTARVMIKDLACLNAVEWGWWLAVSSGDYDDGLVYWDYDAETSVSSVSYSKRYFVMSQFTRYIEAGDVRTGLKLQNNIAGITGVEGAAFLKPDGTVAIVIVNASKVKYQIKLNGLSASAVITTDQKENLALSNQDGEVTLKAYSVTTILARSI